MTRLHLRRAFIGTVLTVGCLSAPGELFEARVAAQSAAGVTIQSASARLTAHAEADPPRPGPPGPLDSKDTGEQFWTTDYDNMIAVQSELAGTTASGNVQVRGNIVVDGDDLHVTGSLAAATVYAQGACQTCQGIAQIADSGLRVDFKISRPSTFTLTGSLSADGSGANAYSFVALTGGPNQLDNEFAANRSFQPALTVPVSAHGSLMPGPYSLYFGTLVNAFVDGESRTTGQFALQVDPLLRPVLVVPGVGATYSSDVGGDFDVSNDLTWLMHRGVQPQELQIDPMTRVYDDLIQTLKNAGYVEGKNLFKVNYDWRLPPGPDDDAIDGTVAGLTASSLADQNYLYAVDYLGDVLRQAAERWALDYPGAPPLDAVDVITHSTGGLVARTYVQSGAAYGGEYSAGRNLPKINNLIMIGVPNQGASKAWNPLHDNWIVDPAFQMVLSKIVNRAYKKVVNDGFTIAGPDYNIDLASISAPQCLDTPEVCFINQYVPTARALLATYNFIDFGAGLTNVNAISAIRNSLLLDLNAGDPNAFAGRVSAKPTIIYGTNGDDTPTTVRQETGPTFTAPPFTHPIAEFAHVLGRDAASGETYYVDEKVAGGGDGTVPIVSSAGQFFGDARVVLKPFTKGQNTTADVNHTALPYNPGVQQLILDTLGVNCPATGCVISSGLATAGLDAIACAAACSNFGLDPVDGFLVDAQGRRLGFSAATGPLTEIPHSVWFGNSDGMGWVFGPVEEPLRVELAGLGQKYDVDATVRTSKGIAAVTDRGVLGLGAPKVLPVPPTGATSVPDTVAPVAVASASPQPNALGWNTGDVAVSIAAQDETGGSGIKEIVYSATGAQPIPNATRAGALAAVAVTAEGQTTITFFARDNTGNTSTPSTIAVAIDRTPPSLTVPPNQTFAQSEPGGAIVGYPALVASDSGSGLATAGCTPASGLLFPLGSTTVTCAAMDNAGNSRSGTFTVIVTAATTTGLDGRMHGAGYIDVGREHQQFLFRVTQRNTQERGWLEFWSNDAHRGPRTRFESTSVDAVDFLNDPSFQPSGGRLAPVADTVRFTGTGRWNGATGYAFEAVATDQGEPGRLHDTFALTVRDAAGNVVLRVNGTLDGGNIQSTRLGK